MLINNATYQRETLSERPIRQPLRNQSQTLVTEGMIQNVGRWNIGPREGGLENIATNIQVKIEQLFSVGLIHNFHGKKGGT